MGEELTRGRLLGYGIGSVGTGIVGALPGLLLLIFLTDTLGVPAGWAGLILLVPKAWDVVLIRGVAAAAGPVRPDQPVGHGGAGMSERAQSVESVLAELATLRAGDLPVTGGTTWAYVYDSGSEEVREVGARAYAEMLDVNALDPTAFPSVVALENSVVGTVSSVLGGGVGTFTSGGTESCLLAVTPGTRTPAGPDTR